MRRPRHCLKAVRYCEQQVNRCHLNQACFKTLRLSVENRGDGTMELGLVQFPFLPEWKKKGRKKNNYRPVFLFFFFFSLTWDVYQDELSSTTFVHCECIKEEWKEERKKYFGRTCENFPVNLLSFSFSSSSSS